jgi:N-acyl-L-homoserine lactone synthetase
MIQRGEFTFVVCETAEQIEAAKRVRHEVFCLEKGWVDHTYAGEEETDAYDDEAVHFLAWRTACRSARPGIFSGP